MISINKPNTFCFEGIHLPRIYINDIAKIRLCLKLLAEHGSLSNSEMTFETERVRSEDIREIYYLLWRLGIGINITKRGKYIVYSANDELEIILDKNDDSLSNLILNRLMYYNPFIAVLAKIKEHNERNEKVTQILITQDLHNGRNDGGRVDNTHPLIRWCRGNKWAFVDENNIVTSGGEKYLNTAKKLNTTYLHHTIDLSADSNLNIVCYLISKNCNVNGTITMEDIIGLTQNSDSHELSLIEVKKTINRLKQIGMPISINSNIISLKKPIYHDITPDYYIKFELNKMDGINEIPDIEEEKISKTELDKLLNNFIKAKIIVISDEDIDIQNYPKNITIFNYNEFLELSNIVKEIKTHTIILPTGWKPLKTTQISGILLAFTRLGGNLVIFKSPMGRRGSNRNLFNWLPYDLSRISFIFNNIRDTGFFTFPLNEEEIYTKTYKKIEINSKKILIDKKYYKGHIIFVGVGERWFTDNYYQEINKNVNIDLNSKAWIFRYIPALNMMKGINTEFDLYPILRKILEDNFMMEFDPVISGKPGQTDIFSIKPFFCCCEVTPPNTNATGFNKVSEVHGHRTVMIYKDKKTNNKYNGNIGSCVIGPSFTISAGIDKAGAVDMADSLKVSLISYLDIYELVCLTEYRNLKENELHSVFFHDGQAEASRKIYEIINIHKE